MRSFVASAFVPSSLTTRPFTRTWPLASSSSACRREAIPARAIIFCNLSCIFRIYSFWIGRFVWPLCSLFARKQNTVIPSEVRNLLPSSFFFQFPALIPLRLFLTSLALYFVFSFPSRCRFLSFAAPCFRHPFIIRRGLFQ